MRVPPATELLPAPERGRTFSARRSVRLGDVDTAARLRLDAIARYLQDVATDDAADCGLDGAFGWVVRRTLIDVRRPARLSERLELTTFCTGTGRSWAERRTSIIGAAGASIETVSLWIQVDARSGRPAPLGDQFHEIYGEAAAGRQVSTRLALPPAPPDTVRRPWTVRRVDLDPFEHVNNAAHWAALEEVVGAGRHRVGQGEIEFLVPIDLDSRVELAADSGDAAVWLVAGERVHTALRWSAASAPEQ